MQKKPQQTADKLKQRSGRSHEEMMIEMLRADRGQKLIFDEHARCVNCDFVRPAAKNIQT